MALITRGAYYFFLIVKKKGRCSNRLVTLNHPHGKIILFTNRAGALIAYRLSQQQLLEASAIQRENGLGSVVAVDFGVEHFDPARVPAMLGVELLSGCVAN